MKKDKYQLARVGQVINNDKLYLKDEFFELFKNDLTKLLKEYYDFKRPPSIKISKESNVYKLEINVDVDRFMSFCSIPK